MNKPTGILCEIFFKDHKSGILNSRIGRIDESQLIKFSTNSIDFIIFKNSYNCPILKKDIEKIIIHHNNSRTLNTQTNSITIKDLRLEKTWEIS
ncbi:MAG: hypothetical protein ACFFDF_21465 [Candidatus Odinarchaeota archaeon]